MTQDPRFGLSDLLAAAGIGALAARFLSLPRPSGARVARTSVRDADARAPPPVQHARAAEAGRGRRARFPWDIPIAGWKDILWRVYAEFSADRVTLIAAGATFYLLLALFPALAAFVSIYGFVADPVTVADHVAFLAGFLPA